MGISILMLSLYPLISLSTNYGMFVITTFNANHQANRTLVIYNRERAEVVYSFDIFHRP